MTFKGVAEECTLTRGACTGNWVKLICMVQASTSMAGSVDEQLRDVLSRFPVVQLAILFGSVASGQARPDSDLDLGILPKAHERL